MSAWADRSKHSPRYFHPTPEPSPPGTLRLYVGGYGVYSADGAAYFIVNDQGAVVAAEWKVLSSPSNRWSLWRCRRRGEDALDRLTRGEQSGQHIAKEVVVDRDIYIRHLETQVGL